MIIQTRKKNLLQTTKKNLANSFDPKTVVKKSRDSRYVPCSVNGKSRYISELKVNPELYFPKHAVIK